MIHAIALNLDNRYLTRQERDDILGYAQSSKSRLDVFDELKRHARAVSEEMVEEMKKLYPNFQKYRTYGWEKAARDVELTILLAANALLLGDKNSLNERFLIWFRSILKSQHFTPQFVEDTYRIVEQRMMEKLSAAASEMARPFLNHLTKFLSDIPEPATPEVGDRQS